MSDARHIADAESDFFVINVTPDFCIVDGEVVPFDIVRNLSPERLGYAKKTYARGVRVLTIASAIQGVEGNMGKGLYSGVSLENGDTIIERGVPKVRAEGNPVARDRDICQMNVKVG